MTTNTLNISVLRVESFAKLFTRLSRKAIRLGLAAPTYKVVGERPERVEVFELSEGDKKSVGFENVVVSDIEITGLNPVKLDGWSFAATVENTGGNANLVFAAPGEVIPPRFHSCGPVCEHCNIRRNRTKLFIVKNENGDMKQVGSTCLEDFVGGNSAATVAALFAFYGEILHDLDAYCTSERNGWEGGANAAYSLLEVVAKSIEVQAVHGWLSRGKAYGTGAPATADRVLLAKAGDYTPTEESLAKAETAIAHFASLPLELAESDSLLANARVLANAGFCSKKSFGLACALWTCYNIALNKAEAARRRAAQAANSKHVFEVGKRIKNIEGTIIRCHSYDTQFGRQVMTVLEDKEGNVLVAKDLGFDSGNVRFTATVAEHSEWNGVKQTKLLRANKVVELTEKWEVVEE